MLLSDFDYDLPEDLIAQRPCEPRDHSRLMVIDKNSGEISHRSFWNLPEYLNPGDLLVFNDTRVIPARLIGRRKETGGRVEVFLLNRKSDVEWEALVKPGRKARPGEIIEFSTELECKIMNVTDFGGRIVRFIFRGIFEEILDKLGRTPLPPYIHEELEDTERYQTVYARERGSAAAPTAGLHFTKELMDKIREKGVQFAFVTLHVGLGTFRPVNVDDVSRHVMHKEYYSVSEECARVVNQTQSEGGRIVAVGTTAIRTLETAGSNGQLTAGSGWTDIFIYPGYKFKMVDAAITNFHLPKSTLLMLISALAGRNNVLSAYREAVQEKYRFFSFGDAMLII